MEKFIKRSMSKANKTGEAVDGLTVLAGVMSSFKQFERKLDKLADNVRWQGATLAELRSLVTSTRGGDPGRAMATQCDAARSRKRMAIQPMSNPYLTAVGRAAMRGPAFTWPPSPTSLPLPPPTKIVPSPYRAPVTAKAKGHRRQHHPATLAKKPKPQMKNYKPRHKL